MVQQTYKRSLSGSVGSGMKSVFGGGGRRFYILEHKVSSKYHKAGECQQIIVDQIEIGRDSKCQVRFDESFNTVSRRHAAIVRDGNNWKLVQLSQTNSTYLNGRKVENEWYLQNGDEIQLSTNGPKLGFIANSGDKGLVKSIGLTARLNLFRQQSLRPYKRALAALSCILVLALVSVAVLGIRFGEKHKQLVQQVNDKQSEIEALQKQVIDLNQDQIKQAASFEKTIKQMEMSAKKDKEEMMKKMDSVSRELGVSPTKIEACFDNVYYIMTIGYELLLDGGNLEWSCSDEKQPAPSWSGTGFLLDNNKFVTARHVIEGWNYDISTEEFLLLNELSNLGRLVAHYMAVSPTGEILKFTDKDFNMNKRRDRYVHSEDGTQYSQANSMEDDYAYADYIDIDGVEDRQGLLYNSNMSRNLKAGTHLTVLGFPYSLGANAIDDIEPVYANAKVSKGKLNNGVILTTDTSFERGNSGGPVFCYDENGDLVVIGIVSAGIGNATGFVVPISKIDNN